MDILVISAADTTTISTQTTEAQVIIEILPNEDSSEPGVDAVIVTCTVDDGLDVEVEVTVSIISVKVLLLNISAVMGMPLPVKEE